MLKITFFGTTTLLFDDGRDQIFFDAHFTRPSIELLFDDGRDQIFFDAHFTRPSIEKYVAGAYVETNTALCDKLIDLHHIDRLRAIFISHTHHDHVMDAPYVANRCRAVIYGSSSAKNVAIGGGVPEERTVVFKDGSEYSIGGYTIRIIKSLHSKPNLQRGRFL